MIFVWSTYADTRVGSTAVTHVAPPSSGLGLANVVSKYGKKSVVAAVHVSNGTADQTNARRSNELLRVQRMLDERVPDHLVVGGFAIVKNPEAYEQPLGEDVSFAFHITGYDPGRYRRSVSSVATYHPSPDQPNLCALPTHDERALVMRTLQISDRRGISLDTFFDGRSWNELRDFFPWMSENAYKAAMTRPRAQIMQQYVGRTLRQNLADGEVLLNHGFQSWYDRGADVLVVARSLGAVLDMLACTAAEDYLRLELPDSPVSAQWRAA